eukprot:637827-Lingulodinium_polyedra.AAC.1
MLCLLKVLLKVMIYLKGQLGAGHSHILVRNGLQAFRDRALLRAFASNRRHLTTCEGRAAGVNATVWLEPKWLQMSDDWDVMMRVHEHMVVVKSVVCG